jgi:hypothetical protein
MDLMQSPQEEPQAQILQLIPAPAQLQAKFGARQTPVIELPLVCLALVRRKDEETIEGVVVEQGKFTLVSHITGFLGYRDGRSRHDGVDWFQKAEGYRQAQQQVDGGQ